MPKRLGEDPASLAEFFGLLVECPMHGGNPEHCQLHHVRELPLHERYEWAKGTDVAEAYRIRSTCAQCMRNQKAAWGLEPQPPSG